jgi:hypothetical protein
MHGHWSIVASEPDRPDRGTGSGNEVRLASEQGSVRGTHLRYAKMDRGSRSTLVWVDDPGSSLALSSGNFLRFPSTDVPSQLVLTPGSTSFKVLMASSIRNARFVTPVTVRPPLCIPTTANIDSFLGSRPKTKLCRSTRVPDPRFGSIDPGSRNAPPIPNPATMHWSIKPLIHAKTIGSSSMVGNQWGNILFINWSMIGR